MFGLNTSSQGSALEQQAGISEEQRLAAIDARQIGATRGESLLRGGNVLGRQAIQQGQEGQLGAIGLGAGLSEAALRQGAADQAQGLAPALGLLDFGDQVRQSATIGGFGQNISDILGGGALDPLIAERQGAARSALGAAGLTRSNVAAEQAAELPTDLAFGLEGLLTGRATDLFSTGLDASQQQGNIFGALGGNLANLFGGTAGAQADILGGTATNLANLEREGALNLSNLVTGASQDIANLQTNQAASSLPLQLAQLEAARNRNILSLGGAALAGGIGTDKLAAFGAGGGAGGALTGILGSLGR